MDRKNHWENIYQSKEQKNVSWYQPTPQTSLDFVKQFHLPHNAKIIDIGGGDSFFADYLIRDGYQDITVLDISETALHKAQKRLADKAANVKWIASDVVTFTPKEKYDFWHDRAAFHFLTNEDDIEKYVETAARSLNPKGILVIGTFSTEGPTKCSGIEIKQYSEVDMTERLKTYFEKISCITTGHKTPFNTIQHFVFCSFKRRNTGS